MGDVCSCLGRNKAKLAWAADLSWDGRVGEDRFVAAVYLRVGEVLGTEHIIYK